jgi:hypothetical protein
MIKNKLLLLTRNKPNVSFLEKTDIDYYYDGEFGYFNLILLPELEKYNGESFNIYTYKDYCYIIKNLFGDKFNCFEINLNAYRAYNHSTDSSNKFYSKLKHITEKFKLSCNLMDFKYLNKQITTSYSQGEKEEYICYFPRMRNTNKPEQIIRNSNKEEVEYILTTLNNKYTNKIIILGCEVLNFDYEKFNCTKVSDIEQSIYYLKNCKFLISNDSGYVDFAKNCGCKKIIIIRALEEYHKVFNPFNCEIKILNNIKTLNNLI